MVNRFFSGDGFMPHGHCYLWDPSLLSLHVISDGLIAAAYFCIPFALIAFLRKRRDLAFPWMFLLFAAFIVSCGLTHLLEIFVIWIPAYWLNGTIKALTALISVPTAILLVKLVPHALRLPSPAELRLANEKALNAEKKATEAILERISDGFVTFDRDWRYACVNSAAGRLLRKVPEELQGKVLWDVFPQTDQSLRQAMEENVVLKVEHFYPEPLNAWFELRCYPAPDGLSVFMVDITERKATEERLRQLSRAVDQSPSSIVITDTRGNIEYINPKFTEVTGYSFEEAVGKNPRILQSGELPREAYAELWATIASGREWRGEFHNKKKNGELFWEAASICAITDDAGAITHYLGVKEDITERKYVEMALLEAEQIAQQANQAKDNFISSLSHELRTPLAPVLLTTSSLEGDTTLSDEVRSQISMVRHSVEMEARLIDDLLDVSKIARGKISLRLEGADVGELLSKALEIVREDIVRKRITVHVEAEAQCETANVDPVRVQQVFWNVLKNALKFTPPGGVISVRAFNPDPEVLCIEIQDTGIGIAPEFIEQIFLPFEQGPVTGDHRFGGLGLGLAISKAIVGLHGGTISVASAGPNQGTTFAIRLPVSRTIQTTIRSSCTPPIPTASNLHILLVEDDENTRRVLSKLLTRDGHHVEAVGTCNAALRSANTAQNGQAEPFQVLVSDLGLPDGSGLDVARQIKARSPEIKAVALSGYGTDDDIRDSIQAGFSTHLTKPVSIEDLRRALVA